MKVSRRETIDRYYLFKAFGWGVFVHRIHHSDPATAMHTHPWTWFSLIFGGYTEERPYQQVRVRRWWNWCRAGVPHRVTLTHGPAWTILVHGPKRCEWAVTDDWGQVKEVEPWSGTENSERKSYVT